MQSSKIGLQKWAIAIYMITTGLNGTSSIKISRDLGIHQESAWHLMRRTREAFVADADKCPSLDLSRLMRPTSAARKRTSTFTCG